MSYEAWGEPDDGPELPDGWLDEDAAQELRDRITALKSQLAARATAEQSRDEDAHVIKRLSGVLAEVAAALFGEEADGNAAELLAKLPERAQMLMLEVSFTGHSLSDWSKRKTGKSHRINKPIRRRLSLLEHD